MSHLSIESFAEANAEIESGRARSEVLEQRGLTEVEWLATREHWLRLIGEEALQHKFDVPSRYQAAFLARREALARGAATTAELAAFDSVEDPTTPVSSGPPSGLPFLRDETAPPPASRRGDFSGLPFRPPGMPAAGAYAAQSSESYPPAPEPLGSMPLSTKSAGAPSSSAHSDSYPPPPTPIAPVISSDAYPPFPQLELAQLAALAAEISVFPENIAVARARYSIDEASHRAAAIVWQARFAADPALYAQYTSLYEKYLSIFAQRVGA